MNSSNQSKKIEFTFSVQELLEISQEINLHYTPDFHTFVEQDAIDSEQKAGGLNNERELRRLLNDDTLALGFSGQLLKRITDFIFTGFAPRFISKFNQSAEKIWFHQQELKDISDEISLRFAPDKTDIQPGLLIYTVDPIHLHAYWSLEVSKNQIKTASNKIQPLTMKIFQERQDTTISYEQKHSKQEWFELSIDQLKGSKQIVLPHARSGGHFSAVIGKKDEHLDFIPIVYSNITALPETNEQQFCYNMVLSNDIEFGSMLSHASGQGKLFI